MRIRAEDRAAAMIILRRRKRSRQQEAGPRVDPLQRLMDPGFTEPLWEYEHSRVDPMIPGTLHGKQIEALSVDSIHRWLFWGNQAGKTTLGAIDVVMLMLGRHPLQATGRLRMPPCSAWASALSWELWGDILLPELLTWSPIDRIISAPEPGKISANKKIKLRADNGSTSVITGKAAEQGAKMYQSARVDVIWFDEEHPKEVYDECQPRLLRRGGRTIGTMTPLKGQATYIYSNIYEPAKNGRVPPERHWYSHAGVADNPGIPPSAIEELKAELSHTPSQLDARLHGHFVKPVGIVYKFDLDRDAIDLEGPDLAAFIRTSKLYGQFDLGKWRFAFAWGGVDREERFTLIDEVFSQNESADVRAKRIHDQLKSYKVKEISIWGECADPEELREINEAFDRLDSPYRFYPVDMQQKNRKKGITRVESLLSRKALRMRRSMGRGQVWRLGMSAAKAGAPMEGSRWLWEMNNWQYPELADGKVQTDDPDDATADGADMMDGTRYVSMVIYGEVEIPEGRPKGEMILDQLAREHAELDEQSGQQSNEQKYGAVLRQ